MAPVVERDVEPELRPGVEEPVTLRILAHDAHEMVGGDAVLAARERCPARAVVLGLEDVRREVVQTVAVHGRDRATRVAL